LNEQFVEYAMGKYGNTVLRVAASVTGNRADAEDIFSDVFFALHRQAGIGSDNHLRAWLIKVAVNMAKNVKKSAWSRKREALDESLAAPVREGGETLDALQKLKPKSRAVIYLHYYEGYIFREIAFMLGIREASARSIANRARNELKDILGDRE
jgi:RNA polymerase sigma-70 factor (ECF subfamily)